MVGVGEVIRVLLVKLGRELFVGVNLEWECLRDRKDLGKVWDLVVAKLLDHLLTDELVGVLVDDILKILAGSLDI